MERDWSYIFYTKMLQYPSLTNHFPEILMTILAKEEAEVVSLGFSRQLREALEDVDEIRAVGSNQRFFP